MTKTESMQWEWKEWRAGEQKGLWSLEASWGYDWIRMHPVAVGTALRMYQQLLHYKDVPWNAWKPWFEGSCCQTDLSLISNSVQIPLICTDQPSHEPSDGSPLWFPFDWDIQRYRDEDDYNQLVKSLHDVLDSKQDGARVYLNDLFGCSSDWMSSFQLWGEGKVFMCMKPFSAYRDQPERNTSTLYWNERFFSRPNSIVLLKIEDADQLQGKLHAWNHAIQQHELEKEEQAKQRAALRAASSSPGGELLLGIPLGVFCMAYLSRF